MLSKDIKEIRNFLIHTVLTAKQALNYIIFNQLSLVYISIHLSSLIDYLSIYISTKVSDYTFDAEKESWCEITLSFDVSQKRLDMVNVIKKSAEKGVIHQVVVSSHPSGSCIKSSIR